MVRKKTKAAPKKTTTTKKLALKKTKKAPVFELADFSPGEVRKLPRPREGFEKFVAPLLALYALEHEELKMKAFSSKEVEARFAAYGSLGPLEASARKHLALVQEARSLHAAKVWSAMLEIYAKARAAARTNAGVRRKIAEFTSFMKVGPRKKKAAGERG